MWRRTRLVRHGGIGCQCVERPDQRTSTVTQISQIQIITQRDKWRKEEPKRNHEEKNNFPLNSIMLRSLLATFRWREQNLKFPLFPAWNTLEDSPTSTLRNLTLLTNITTPT